MSEHLAIVGSGVAGLGCAWNLRDRARITILEQDGRPGGHTNTVMVDEDGGAVPIDTGFIVFNRVTYPRLCELFAELEVPTKASEMSFSVRHDPSGLEYNGMGINRVFAQRRNLFRPRFHRFLGQIQKFFRVANETLQVELPPDLSIAEFAARHDLGEDFLNLYLLPMSSAVWSTDSRDVLGFPASTLLRFFHNHGFLGVDTHHPWFTVEGGARTYRDKILAGVGSPRLGARVVAVADRADHAEVRLADGEVLSFDRVVIASHGDQALAMLGAPDAEQARLLAPFRYQENHATLHRDSSVMPRTRRAWASWNYLIDGGAESRCATHYWMNALQGVSDRENYFVSLNSRDRIADEKVLYETIYHHPVFTREAVQAQDDLPRLNQRSPQQRIFFCGSYFKYGFHEDAYRSGLDLAGHLSGQVLPAA